MHQTASEMNSKLHFNPWKSQIMAQITFLIAKWSTFAPKMRFCKRLCCHCHNQNREAFCMVTGPLKIEISVDIKHHSFDMFEWFQCLKRMIGSVVIDADFTACENGAGLPTGQKFLMLSQSGSLLGSTFWPFLVPKVDFSRFLSV